MKKLVLNILVLILWYTGLHSQANLQELGKIPRERSYLHTNTTLLFPGEYLYYQFYSLNSKANELSSISKIGYVDLLNEKMETVFHHKLLLSQGTGFSDFFIPADIPSGNYMLIGYTNWMRNFDPDTFYRTDITIINPYSADQKIFLADSLRNRSNRSKSIPEEKNANYSLPVSLSLSKETYAKREKVQILLKREDETELHGNYSLSVRKKEEIPVFKKTTLDALSKKIIPNNEVESFKYLPETRGSMISGRIIPKSFENVQNRKIMLSLPGDNSKFSIVSTEPNGKFTTQLIGAFDGKELWADLMDTVGIKGIQIDNMEEIDYGIFEFYRFTLDKEMEEQIKNRSINNQIENAYLGRRPDSLILPVSNKPFYDGDITTYELDDYTRYITLRETFIEIIDNVWIDEGKNRKPEFKVRYYNPMEDSGERPIVLLDGVYIQDHYRLLQLPSKAIKTIRVGRNQYLYGPHSFQGIVDISTFNGGSYREYLSDTSWNFPIERPRLKKEYYREDYSDTLKELKKRIPDFREQLIWQPDIKPQGPKLITTFYTSDIPGIFEIVLEGITGSNVPVSIVKEFTVE